MSVSISDAVGAADATEGVSSFSSSSVSFSISDDAGVDTTEGVSSSSS